MALLDKIKKPVAQDLARYEEFLRSALQNEHGMTHDMLDYIFENRGKAIRPLLALLSAGLYNEGGALPEDSMLTAMLVEMMHTASLIHDDVIDESSVRRGKPSVKAVWNSRRAVIIGDYILAKSFSAGLRKTRSDILLSLIESMGDLCEGELLQSEQSDRLEMTRELHYTIIYKKTASLLGTCCGTGALSTGVPGHGTSGIRDFGVSLGMAFQIKDDILDYHMDGNTGKPACNDLRDRKITLPLLVVMEESSADEKRNIISLLQNIHSNAENIDTLRDMVVEKGGLDKALTIMDEYLDAARNYMRTYPASEYRDSLLMLCDYIGERNM